MTETGTSDDTLAARLEIDRTTISRLRRGKRMPSVEMMRAIWEATGGAVTANDFVHSIVREINAACARRVLAATPRPEHEN